MTDSFYRQFEDEHRGSRELITSRLLAYSGFLRGLRELSPTMKALDVGCGRGEWLEVLGQHGIAAKGVDLDEGMLAACRTRGLDVVNMDALKAIRELPDESLGLVSAFHLVEHIPFDDLRILVQEAHRVLKPGGILILETPNPENLSVGTNSFYLDPTHHKPIPPALLAFVAKFSGFNRRIVMRLQESQDLRNNPKTDLMAVLEGVSPDYSIVAQKQATTEVMATFDAVFGADYGLSLSVLAQRYDAQRERRFERIESTTTGSVEMTELRTLLTSTAARAARFESRAVTAESRMALADTRLVSTETRIGKLEQQIYDVANEIHVRALDQAKVTQEALERARLAELHALATEQRAREAIETNIRAFHSSASWRLTTPLRISSTAMRRARRNIKHMLGAVARIIGLESQARSIYRRLRGFPPVTPVAPLTPLTPFESEQGSAPDSPAPQEPPTTILPLASSVARRSAQNEDLSEDVNRVMQQLRPRATGIAKDAR